MRARGRSLSDLKASIGGDDTVMGDVDEGESATTGVAAQVVRDGGPVRLGALPTCVPFFK